METRSATVPAALWQKVDTAAAAENVNHHMVAKALHNTCSAATQ